MTKETKKYPFNEGDDYWTIESTNNGKELEIVWSCWDYISEELYDENPEKLLFAAEQEAIEFIANINAGTVEYFFNPKN